jgi:hypothetical protein
MQHGAMRVNSMAEYWTSIQGIMESNLHLVNFIFVSCSRHFVLLHSAYTKNCYTKVVQFSEIYYSTSLYDPTVSGASVNPTSQVRSYAMLVLPIAGN